MNTQMKRNLTQICAGFCLQRARVRCALSHSALRQPQSPSPISTTAARAHCVRRSRTPMTATPSTFGVTGTITLASGDLLVE